MDEFGINSGYVAELLERYLANPESVDDNWRSYFASRLGARPLQTNGNGATNGHGTALAVAAMPVAPVLAPARAVPSAVVPTSAELQGRVSQLINAYRQRGHLFARVDPLRLEPAAPPQLELANF